MCSLKKSLEKLKKQYEYNVQEMMGFSPENLVQAVNLLAGCLKEPHENPDVQKVSQIVKLSEQNKNIIKTITRVEQILEKKKSELGLLPDEQEFVDYIKKIYELNEFFIQLENIKAGFKKIYSSKTFNITMPKDEIFDWLLSRYRNQIKAYEIWWGYLIYQAREGSNKMRVLRELNPVKMKTLSDSDKEKRDSILESFCNKHSELLKKKEELALRKKELFQKLKEIEEIKKIVHFDYICSILGFKNDEMRNHINEVYEEYADIFQKLQTDCDSFLLEMNKLIEQCNREYNTKDDILSLYNFCITNMFPFPGKPDDGAPVIPFPEILERDSDKEKLRKYIEYLVNRGFQGFHK
jgi:hypothetical protein